MANRCVAVSAFQYYGTAQISWTSEHPPVGLAFGNFIRNGH